MHTFRCRDVVNITNGFGTTVENKIEGSNIPKMIEDQSNGLAKIVDYNKWWDSGYFSHDLYLEYDIKIDCAKAIKNKAGKFVSGVLNILNLQTSTVMNSIRDSIEEGFVQELSGCGKNIIAVLKSCTIENI